jgi:hypothetical protein
VNPQLLASATLWKQRYESLRQHVVDRPQVLASDPLGLIDVSTRGLAGWMQTWWEEPEEPTAPLAAPQLRRQVEWSWC